jgi:hypothetical protein
MKRKKASPLKRMDPQKKKKWGIRSVQSNGNEAKAPPKTPKARLLQE